MYRSFFKRFLDLLISLFLLILLSPLWIAITIALFFTNKGQPFFIQERPGYKEKPIRLIKFKTMNDKQNEKGELFPDNERLTPIGNWLRSTSLDELPQLFNVLKGDTSLIGPRPLLSKYLNLYSKEQRKRHDIKPGITGLAQVNGRNSIPWTKKFEYDVYYVEHLSFRMDLEIFIKTIHKIISGDGINQSDTRPMEPFNGYN